MNGCALLGSVRVHTTTDRPSTPEELAQRAADRIVYIGEQSHPAVREQARAFKAQVVQTLARYFEEARKAERATVCAALAKQGRADLADIVRSL